jgi:hypothetical protein
VASPLSILLLNLLGWNSRKMRLNQKLYKAFPLGQKELFFPQSHCSRKADPAESQSISLAATRSTSDTQKWIMEMRPHHSFSSYFPPVREI